tara:strand:+ start:69023 stop:70891 length:1869 start_codon:yes stop_codon:yes gene_type:complete
MKYLRLRLFENHEDLNGKWSFLRKEPKYLEFFKKLNDNSKVPEDKEIEISKDYYEIIQKHRNTIKQNNIDLFSLNNYEELTDEIADIELIEKFNKFTKLLPNHLRNELRGSKSKSKKFREVLIDFDYDEYKNIFLKKVSRYKSFESFYDAIKHYLGSNNKSIKELVDEIEESDGIRVFKVSGKMLVAMVFSKEASCKFGSSQWCISGNGGSYWDSYVPNKLGVQYFIWDFSRVGTDMSSWSKIGITIYKDGLVAFDNTDSPITQLHHAIGKNTEKWLLSIDQLSNRDAKEYFRYNLNAIPKYINKYGKLHPVLNDKFKKQVLWENPKKYMEIFSGIDFLTDQEVLDLLDKYPAMINKKMISNRLPSEKVIDYIIKAPDLLLSRSFNNDHFENLSKSNYRKMIFNLIKRAGGWKEELDAPRAKDWYGDSYDFKNAWLELVKIKPEYLRDENFIESLFKINPDYSLRYLSKLLTELPFETMNSLYNDSSEQWDEILNSSGKWVEQSKHFNNVKGYYKNKGAMKNFEDNDLYVFNARYVNKKVGENPTTGKSYYERVLEPEKMVKYTPFKEKFIPMMKIRAQIQGDLTTYGMWVSKDLFSNDDDIDNMLKDEWFVNLVDSKKFRM